MSHIIEDSDDDEGDFDPREFLNLPSSNGASVGRVDPASSSKPPIFRLRNIGFSRFLVLGNAESDRSMRPATPPQSDSAQPPCRRDHKSPLNAYDDIASPKRSNKTVSNLRRASASTPTGKEQDLPAPDARRNYAWNSAEQSSTIMNSTSDLAPSASEQMSSISILTHSSLREENDGHAVSTVPIKQEAISEYEETWTEPQGKQTPVVLLPAVKKLERRESSQSDTTDTRKRKRQTIASDDIDELSSEALIGLPKENYKPRPSRSRSAQIPTQRSVCEPTTIPSSKMKRRRVDDTSLCDETDAKTREQLLQMGFTASQTQLVPEEHLASASDALDFFDRHQAPSGVPPKSSVYVQPAAVEHGGVMGPPATFSRAEVSSAADDDATSAACTGADQVPAAAREATEEPKPPEVAADVSARPTTGATKKRGRGKAQSDAADDAKVDEQTAGSGKKGARRGRGRPRKSEVTICEDEAIEGEPHAATEDTVSEMTLEVGDDAAQAGKIDATSKRDTSSALRDIAVNGQTEVAEASATTASDANDQPLRQEHADFRPSAHADQNATEVGHAGATPSKPTKSVDQKAPVVSTTKKKSSLADICARSGQSHRIGLSKRIKIESLLRKTHAPKPETSPADAGRRKGAGKRTKAAPATPGIDT